MGRSFYTLSALLGFLVGVALYLVWQPSFLVIVLVIVMSVMALLWSRDMPRLYGILIAMVAVFLGLGRAALSVHHVSPDQVDFYNGQKVVLEGVIVEEDVRQDKAKYTIRIDDLSPIGAPIGAPIEAPIGVEGDVLITLNKYPQHFYGERVRLVGELQEPGEFNGFNYGNYLSRFGIYSVMYYPKIDVLGVGQGSYFWSAMNYLRRGFLSQINQLFPEPHASFEAGLLVGARKGIPDELMDKFNITGLTHIIAISGYNITIIIVFVMWLLGGLPRMLGFYVAIGAIVLFTIFVGASPAVVRASIMGILGLIALNYGRQNNIHITVLTSAALMVLMNPKILWWDVGFQLSFAAVLGLIYVAPLFDRYSTHLPQALGIREAILMTLSAQVIALPIIVYNFERLSIIAPLSNLLVAFAIPPAMLFGFAGVLISFVSHGLGLIFAYLAWAILSYIIKVIEWTAAIPYASVEISGMKFWMMGVYYAALIGLLVFYYRRGAVNQGRGAINRAPTDDR
jgi:competence protein ComEC